MKKLILVLCLCFLPPCAAMANDLKSLDKSGLTAVLEKNKGKVVMLNFFATWCPPCRAEIPELVKLRDAYSERDFLLIGLSVDENKAAVLPFTEKAGVNYQVYLCQNDITDSYNVTSVPHNAFIARDGRIVISEPGMAEVNALKQVVDELLKRK